MTSILLGAFSLFCVGPSLMLSLPDSLGLMAVGQVLLGITIIFLFIPCLPEMVNVAVPYFPGQEERVNNLACGMFNSFLGGG